MTDPPPDEPSLLASHLPSDGPIGVLIDQRPDLAQLAHELKALKVEAIVVQHTVDNVWVPIIVFDGGTHWKLETRPTQDGAYSAGVYVLKAMAKILADVRKKVPPAILSEDISAYVATETAVRLWRRRDQTQG